MRVTLAAPPGGCQEEESNINVLIPFSTIFFPMSNNSISNTIERHIQQHREWLKNGTEFYNRQIKYIEMELQDVSLHSLALLSQWVAFLGEYYGTRGVIRILDLDDRGWSDVAGGIECYVWTSRLQTFSYYSCYAPERSGRLGALLARIPLTVCLLASFTAEGDETRKQEIWSLLDRIMSDPNERIAKWWRTRKIEPFFIHLYARQNDLQSPFEAEDVRFPIFKPILEQWNDDDAIGTALTKACDYHVRHMTNVTSRDAEFDRPPFDLIPIEVFAIKRLRSICDLGDAEIEHPLMHVIGPRVPATEPEELTAVLSRVESMYNEFHKM